jgi:hypothetical protein
MISSMVGVEDRMVYSLFVSVEFTRVLIQALSLDQIDLYSSAVLI